MPRRGEWAGAVERVATVATVMLVLGATTAGGVAVGSRDAVHVDAIGRPFSAAPTPAGPVLTVFVLPKSDGVTARIVSYLSVSGRWCVSTWYVGQLHDAADGTCVDDGLGTARDRPLGHVDASYEIERYDGIHMWTQGVAGTGVARIVVAYDDGHVRAARVLMQGRMGEVFSAVTAGLSYPTVVRAYDATGRVLEERAISTG